MVLHGFRNMSYFGFAFKPVIATGGEITNYTKDGVVYKVHSFSTVGSSTFTITDLGTLGEIDYLIVAGGGGGGPADNEVRPGGGGGGAGGLLTTIGDSPYLINTETYSISVGAGGSPFSKGGNSSFFTVVAEGGGRGGSSQDVGGANQTGGNGGSGGGGGRSLPGGLGILGQGHDGSLANPSTSGTSGGMGGSGGGAGGPATTSGSVTTIPGPGRSIDITGTSIVYALGGTGGDGRTSAGDGPGGTNERGHGGGGGGLNRNGLSGGSGIVVIRYIEGYL